MKNKTKVNRQHQATKAQRTQRNTGLLCAALWCCLATGAAAQNRVSVVDTLYNADGSRAQGSLRISWPAFTSPDGKTITRGESRVNIANGAVSVDLVPTAGATPAGIS